MSHIKTSTTPGAYLTPTAGATGKLESGWGGGASSLATLNASSKVVENPASASATAGNGVIPIAGATGALASGFLTDDTPIVGEALIYDGSKWTSSPQTVATSSGLSGGTGVVVSSTSATSMVQNDVIWVTGSGVTTDNSFVTISWDGTAATGLTHTVSYTSALEANFTQESASVGTDFGTSKAYLHMTTATPNFAILLHGDGTDGSTTIIDTGSGSQGHTWTANGNVQIDTAQSVFGGSSWLFDGTGDNLELAATSDMSFAGDFGISLRVRFNSVATFNWMINNQQSTNKFVLVAYPTGEIELTLDNASVSKSAAGAVTTGTWYHLQIDRVGTGITIRKNGTTIASGTKSGTIGSSSTAWNIGKGSGGLYDLNGWIDEFAVLNGSAINSSDFTSPVAAYSDATFPLTGYYILWTAANMLPLTGVGDITAITITQSEPTGTQVRWLASFDGGTTWKDSAGSTVAIADIHTSGSTAANMITYLRDTLTLPNVSLMLASGLKTNDATLTPSVTSVAITYNTTTPKLKAFESDNPIFSVSTWPTVDGVSARVTKATAGTVTNVKATLRQF